MWTLSVLQQQIIDELKVKPTINVEEEIRKSIDFLKNYAKKHPFLKGFVLGISGGQDSTLTGKLAQMAVDGAGRALHPRPGPAVADHAEDRAR